MEHLIEFSVICHLGMVCLKTEKINKKVRGCFALYFHRTKTEMARS